jgi:hypothetical protein
MLKNNSLRLELAITFVLVACVAIAGISILFLMGAFQAGQKSYWASVLSVLGIFLIAITDVVRFIGLWVHKFYSKEDLTTNNPTGLKMMFVSLRLVFSIFVVSGLCLIASQTKPAGFY